MFYNIVSVIDRVSIAVDGDGGHGESGSRTAFYIVKGARRFGWSGCYPGNFVVNINVGGVHALIAIS